MPERDPRDRDARRVKTPPAGVRAQTASPVEHSWDEDLTPLPYDTHAALSRVDGRVKSTNLATMDRVDAVRSELSGSVKEVDRRVVDLAQELARLAASTAEMAGKLDILVDDRSVDRREVSAVRVESVKADLLIRRDREVASIEDRRQSRAFAAALALKLCAGAGLVWGLLSAMILSGRC